MPKMPFLHEDEPDATSARKSSRLFYAVLALCLLAVGGVAVSAFSKETNAPLKDTTPTTVPTMRATTSAAPAAVTQAKPTTVTTTSSATATATTSTTPPSLFVLPMGNVVLTPFSEQPTYNETLQSYETHTAVDFDGEEGQAVHALAQGNISRIEEDPLWGKCITVDHGDGIVSVYRGVECRLSMGSIVEAGQEIGKLASIPCETTLGPHLHLELYQSGTAVDVSRLLGDELVTRTTADS